MRKCQIHQWSIVSKPAWIVHVSVRSWSTTTLTYKASLRVLLGLGNKTSQCRIKCKLFIKGQATQRPRPRTRELTEQTWWPRWLYRTQSSTDGRTQHGNLPAWISGAHRQHRGRISGIQKRKEECAEDKHGAPLQEAPWTARGMFSCMLRVFPTRLDIT